MYIARSSSWIDRLAPPLLLLPIPPQRPLCASATQVACLPPPSWTGSATLQTCALPFGPASGQRTTCPHASLASSSLVVSSCALPKWSTVPSPPPLPTCLRFRAPPPRKREAHALAHAATPSSATLSHISPADGRCRSSPARPQAHTHTHTRPSSLPTTALLLPKYYFSSQPTSSHETFRYYTFFLPPNSSPRAGALCHLFISILLSFESARNDTSKTHPINSHRPQRSLASSPSLAFPLSSPGPRLVSQFASLPPPRPTTCPASLVSRHTRQSKKSRGQWPPPKYEWPSFPPLLSTNWIVLCR